MYIAEIRHKRALYAGKRDLLVERDLWDQVASQMAARQVDRRARTNLRGSVAKIAVMPMWRLWAGDEAGVNDFKWRHFRGEIILWGVRWYCKYGISYRNREEMLEERGIGVDHTTLYRWIWHYTPEMEKRLRWLLEAAGAFTQLGIGKALEDQHR